MSVMVDSIRQYPHSKVFFRGVRQTAWCHMVVSRDSSFDELHEFAARIGLKRSWFQGDHYDLTPSRRAAAVRAGAREIEDHELKDRLRGPRRVRA